MPMRGGTVQATDSWLPALGGLATLIGAKSLYAPAAMAAATRNYFLVSLVAGLLLLGAGLLLIVGVKRSLALVICLAVGSALFVNQALALTLKTIPCTSPG